MKTIICVKMIPFLLQWTK